MFQEQINFFRERNNSQILSDSLELKKERLCLKDLKMEFLKMMRN